MSQQDRRNFEDWFGVNLERMIADTNAGFICAMVAFPLNRAIPTPGIQKPARYPSIQ
jgi:hypothetical protein